MAGRQIDLDSYVPFLLGAIANRMARGASRLYLERFRIGINEWRILAHVRLAPGTTANEICQSSGVDKGAASRSVAALERDGHIRVMGSTNDPRRRGLWLTPSGDELHDAVIELALEREAKLLAGLDKAEVTTLLQLLRRLNLNAKDLSADVDQA
jgi:DNA-binding MarR family transcriptional regulator